MTHIDIKTVEKIAHLSRLEFSDSEKQELVNGLDKILGWMEQLNEVNTDNVEPLIHMSAELNIFREDIPHTHLAHKKALINAPKKDSDYIRVPKVIE